MGKKTILHFLQPEIMQRRRKKRKQRIAKRTDVDDDKIDEFKEVMKQLEPKYRRYANWRI